MLRSGIRFASVGLVLAVFATAQAPPACGQDIEWIRQFGTANTDGAWAIAVDATGVYVAGYAIGNRRDAFVRKYDADGNEVWTRQFGTGGDDIGFSVSADASGVYVAGLAGGEFPGQIGLGSFDGFVRKCDADGNELWTRQVGTTGLDLPARVSVGASGVYVVGFAIPAHSGTTSDAYVLKFDSNGNQLWAIHLGNSPAVSLTGVSVDASGVYVAGGTSGTLPGQINAGGNDAFVRKYDFDGNEVWTRQFGSLGNDSAFAIYVGGMEVYVAGATDGTLPGASGAGSIFVRKFDMDGNAVWATQFGTAIFDPIPFAAQALGVWADSSGVYVAGGTEGALPGQISEGLADAFVRKYDSDGDEVWTRQLGTPAADVARGVVLDASGLYFAGETSGSLPGQTNAGFSDRFAAKFFTNPVADAGPDITLIVGESATFDGTSSFDVDGSIASFDWDFGDGGTANGAIVTHVYATAGEFTATLTVTDDEGDSDADTTSVTVRTPAQAILSLSDLVASFNFQQGISNSLDSKLQQAHAAFDAANAGQQQNASNLLMAFINEVDAQRGKELTDAQADTLVAFAVRILAAL
ncbi:MAG: PKD domain-containing protein [Candidatus Acidiferrales bacterium]